MPEIETILLILVAIGALMGGMFSKYTPGMVVIFSAFSYFIVAFFVLDKSESLWFVTLMMGFCLAGVTAMVGAFAGRSLAKLLPRKD